MDLTGTVAIITGADLAVDGGASAGRIPVVPT